MTESFDSYPTHLHKDITEDLEFASRISDHFYHGKFLWGPVISRMLQFTRLSPTFRGLMQDLFAGSQTYMSLHGRVWGNLGKSLREMVANKLIPSRLN